MNLDEIYGNKFNIIEGAYRIVADDLMNDPDFSTLSSEETHELAFDLWQTFLTDEMKG